MLALTKPAQQPVNIILPLYDLVTSVDASGNVTANFMMSGTWNNQINNTGNFKFFYVNGNTSAFSPNGNWQEAIPNAYSPPSGSQVTITFSGLGNNNSRGTLWIQYMGNSGETADGVAEASVVAAQFSGTHQQGHGGRPGHIVPIIDTTPNQQIPQVPIQFLINAPFSGWGTSAPNFWMNTGNNNSPYPGNGWQAMNTSGLSDPLGSSTVTVTGNPNANAGYYCVGCNETYTPSESYNTNNALWAEFSAIIRPYTAQ